jgi:dolichol kinase
MPALANSTHELQMVSYATELRDFLERLPRRVKRGHLEEARRQCERIVQELPQPKPEASWSGAWARVRTSLVDLERSLDGKAAKAYVLARYDETARAYEQWVAARRAASRTGESAVAKVGSLKPLIGARTIFHICSGVVATVCYQLFLTRLQSEVLLLIVLGAFASLEISRRFSPRWNHFLAAKVFHGIARPREYYKVNSSTLYVLGLVLLTPVFSRPAVLTGVLILAFADPAAAWIGRRYGKTKIYQSKSVVGSLAFAAAGTLVTSVFLLAFYSDLPLGHRLLAASLASVVGAVAEVFSSRLDDNLSIPVASVLMAALFI